MVPVVPSFSNGTVGHIWIFTRVGHDIIGVIAIQVCCRVNKPCKVEDDTVTKGTGYKKGIPEVFSPKVLRHLCWPDITDVQGKPRVQFFLKGNTPIFGKIGKVHFTPRLVHSGVLLHQKPAHVGVEESSGSIVGISIRFAEFVVDAMIATPVVDTSLVGKTIAKHQEKSDRPGSLIGSVRPKTVYSYCDSYSTVIRQWLKAKLFRVSTSLLFFSSLRHAGDTVPRLLGQ